MDASPRRTSSVDGSALATSAGQDVGTAESVAQEVPACAAPEAPPPGPSATSAFRLRATPEFVKRIPRGKIPLRNGFSMRSWTELLSTKLRRGGETTRSREAAEKAGGPDVTNSAPPSSKTTPPTSKSALPTLLIDEIEKHCTEDDLWLVVRGVVYDVTQFQRFHPGGEQWLRECGGKDCTEVYDHFHRWVSCEGMLGPMAVGTVTPTSRARASLM